LFYRRCRHWTGVEIALNLIAAIGPENFRLRRAAAEFVISVSRASPVSASSLPEPDSGLSPATSFASKTGLGFIDKAVGYYFSGKMAAALFLSHTGSKIQAQYREPGAMLWHTHAAGRREESPDIRGNGPELRPTAVCAD